MLSDEKAQKYDQLGSSYREVAENGRAAGRLRLVALDERSRAGIVEFTNADMNAGDLFSEFFRNIFGGSPSEPPAALRAGAHPGQNLEVAVQVSLKTRGRAPCAPSRRGSAS